MTSHRSGRRGVNGRGKIGSALAILAFPGVLAACTGVIGEAAEGHFSADDRSRGGRGAMASGSTGGVPGSAAGHPNDPGAADAGPGVPTGGTGGGFVTGPEACDEQAVGPTAELRRLAQPEYEATIRSVLEEALSVQEVANLWPRIEDSLDDIPVDLRGDTEAPFRRMDQGVADSHVRAYYELGVAVARVLADDPARVERLLACGGDVDSECIGRFVERFGRIAYRRPITPEDVDFLARVYDDSAPEDAVENLVAVMLNAPEVSYHVELGEPTSDTKVVQLQDHEVANRLAYLLWSQPPDASLREAVDRGEFATADGYSAAVDAMLDDPRTDDFLARLSGEWLNVEGLGRLNRFNDLPDFVEYVRGALPSASLHREMMADVEDSMVYHARAGDSVADWLASPYSFAREDGLASIYEVQPWDGVGKPPQFTQPERAGLLTRAALLTTDLLATRPILKGVAIRRRLLCDFIPPPPVEGMNAMVGVESGVTTRQKVAALTEQPGTLCAACHKSVINPLGFVTEAFDMLGRVRASEVQFSPEGERLGEAPIDNDPVVPAIVRGDDRTARDAHEVTAQIIESGKVEACLARQIVRYVEARPETSSDGCAMYAMGERLKAGASVLQVVREYALRPEFRQRTLGEGVDP